MALETLAMRELERLQIQQIDERTRLLKNQQKQRETLFIEQEKVYKTLGLSIENMPDEEITSMHNIVTNKQKSRNLIDTISNISDSIQSKTDSDEEQKISTVEESKLKAHASNGTDKVKYSNKQQPIRKMHNQKSSVIFENKDQSPYHPKKPAECIDDIPIPSIKKNFKLLLEEKLNGSEKIVINDKFENKSKKPFLKKGDGLIRFRMHKKKNDMTKNSTLQGVSSLTSKENIENRRSYRGLYGICPIPKVPLKKLNLGNVSLSNRKPQRLSSSSNTVSEPQENVIISTILNESNEIDESDRSDINSSRLETKMFELLEEKAENSSFCSTSSAVLTFMQQSTPIKLKKIRNNLHFQRKKTEVNLANNKTSDGNMHLETVSLCDRNSQNSPNQSKVCKDVSILNHIQRSSDNKKLHDSDNRVVRNNSNKNIKHHQYYLSDVDKLCGQLSCTEAEFATKNLSSGDTNVNCLEVYQKADADISVHVRFSECNEYKSLTDVSTISRDSYNDPNKMSSNCSTSIKSLTDVLIDPQDIFNHDNLIGTDESNPSSKTCNSVKSNQNFYGISDYKSILHNQDTDNEEFISNDSSGNYDHNDTDIFDDQDIDLELKKSMKHVLKWNDPKITAECYEETKALNPERCESKQKLPMSDYVEETLLKSDLLKSRLFELEREIDIFKKENLALTSERQKFHDGHDQLQKEFQEKLNNLEKKKTQMDNILQEEKKKLAQEKLALENRLKYAKEKSLKTKQERQEIESLKEELEKLHKDISDKENRWQATQARQRSQFRVLQMENVKLKQEIDKLKELKKKDTKYEKPMTLSDTRVIHEINKHLDDQRSHINIIHSKHEEKRLTTAEKKLKFSVNSCTEKVESTRLNHQRTNKLPTEGTNVNDAVQVTINQEKNQENILKKRCLYESLLRDAANESENNCDNGEQHKTLNENMGKTCSHFLVSKNEEDNRTSVHNRLEESELNANKNSNTDLDQDLNAIHGKQKLVQNEQLRNKNLKTVQSTYKQFIQDVINPKTEEKHAFGSDKNFNFKNSADFFFTHSQKQLLSDEIPSKVNRIQPILPFDADKKLTENKYQEFIESNRQSFSKSMEIGNHVTSSQIVLSEVNHIDFNLNPCKKHQKPLSQSTKRIISNSEHDKTNAISESNFYNKFTLRNTQQDTREVEYLDGHIEYWYSNGNVKRVYPDRNISKMIYYNGDVCETIADSYIKYFYAATKTWQTTYPDGFEILEFPDGQQERRTIDGVVEVSFPDGSVRLIQPDGIEKWILSDGIITEIFPNGKKTLVFPNGQREIHTSNYKSREYPDGTVKYIYLDGTQKTRYSNGRIRMKDKDGNVIMDTC